MWNTQTVEIIYKLMLTLKLCRKAKASYIETPETSGTLLLKHKIGRTRAPLVICDVVERPLRPATPSGLSGGRLAVIQRRKFKL